MNFVFNVSLRGLHEQQFEMRRTGRQLEVMRHHSPTADTRASVDREARRQDEGNLMDRCRERERTSQSKHVRDPITTKVQTWYRLMERHNIDWRQSEVERVGADIDSLSDS